MRDVVIQAIQLMLTIRGREGGPTKAADILAAMYLELDQGSIVRRRPVVMDWLDQCSRCIASHKGFAAMFPETAKKMDKRMLEDIEHALKPEP